jgi:agmatinase
MTDFDPNAAARPDSGIFGLPCSEADSTLVYLPVPWEATVSYGEGAARAPAAILEASRQVDLYDLEVERPYAAGLYLLPESAQIHAWNDEARALAREILAQGGEVSDDPQATERLRRVNELGEALNRRVYEETDRLLAAGKIVGLVGGDHSVPLGALRAVAARKRRFGILHLDAHADTRRAYEGFTFSHASIMYNVLTTLPEVTRLVQVGVRDCCEAEIEFSHAQGERVQTFFAPDLARRKYSGIPWAEIAREVTEALPEEVWISFDVDGLDPSYCPHTGTPVPGGLDFEEAVFLIATVARSGRRLVGFDLTEVAPDPTGASQWDANVGARLLYKLSAWTLVSQGRASPARLR